jgi:hypothetical protein
MKVRLGVGIDGTADERTLWADHAVMIPACPICGFRLRRCTPTYCSFWESCILPHNAEVKSMTNEQRLAEYARQIKDADDEIALQRCIELFEWGVEVGRSDIAARVIAFAKAQEPH